MFAYLCVTIVFICSTSKIFVTASANVDELIKLLHDTCVEETGVSEDLITKVNSDKVFADDEKLKCYLKCLMTQAGCMSNDGIVDEEAVIGLILEPYRERVAPVIRKCGTKIGANPCENAWLTHKCYLKEDKEYALI